MLFNAFPFPLFLVVVFGIFYFIPPRYRKILLVVASYVFYSFWNWKFSFLLAFSTLTDYWCARGIGACSSEDRKNALLGFSLLANLGILGFFKYYNFFITSFLDVFDALGLNPSVYTLKIILPVGISFYTFQTLSYTIDVRKGVIRPTRHFIDFALYVSFFPQLVAGPIERARNLLPQLEALNPCSRQGFTQGFYLILSGYLKKVVIGDQLSPFVDHTFTHWETLDSIQLWEGIILFALQIYFDFSGYSDIARGIAKWFGIDLMINFKQPYFSQNVTEFWTRWHISLSSWLKEYLYIPLGGNRKGDLRTNLNLMTTMLLGGLWHGASWNFVLWGLFHGVYLMVHKGLMAKLRRKLFPSALLAGWLGFCLKIAFTQLVILLTWLLFRAPDFETALGYFVRMVQFQGTFDPFVLAFLGVFFLILALIDYPIYRSDDEFIILKWPPYLRYLYTGIALVLIVIFALKQDVARPFIYFQF